MVFAGWSETQPWSRQWPTWFISISRKTWPFCDLHVHGT